MLNSIVEKENMSGKSKNSLTVHWQCCVLKLRFTNSQEREKKNKNKEDGEGEKSEKQSLAPYIVKSLVQTGSAAFWDWGKK